MRKTWLARFFGSLALSMAFMFSMMSDASAGFWETTGDNVVHDPTIIKVGDSWHVFSTGEGIQHLTSTDGLTWTRLTKVFSTPFSWWSQYVPNQSYNDVWAPDIEYYNGKYYLFYSISSFGSRDSAIGLASSTNINGPWTDHGMVTRTTSSDNYNAIDPQLFIDPSGKPWLTYGSFWSGIKLTRLNEDTLKPTGTLYSIATRPAGVEAPTLTYRNGYYYLFASIDSCCNGVNSTYKMVVGRSQNITGPYLDKNGVSMLNGGGTIIDAGNTRWKGPGHQDVYENNIIIRHAYDATANGTPKLLINDLYWDSAGWPTYELTPGKYRLINRHSGKALEVYNFGNADGDDVVQWADWNGTYQQWNLVDSGGGYFRLINVGSGKALDVLNFSTDNGGNVIQWTDLNGTNQQWRFVDNNNGSYDVVNRNSGLLLEVSNGSTSDGADVIQWSDNNGAHQQWKLVQVQ